MENLKNDQIEAVENKYFVTLRRRITTSQKTCKVPLSDTPKL